MYFPTMFAVLAASAVVACQADDGWTKFLLTDSATKNGAVCLDGSPGGGYIRRGDPKKWIIFHQGGGWCSSDDNCADRAATDLGSSNGWGPTYTDTYEGSQLFSSPPFSSYTQVYAMYCDGGSWTGDVEEPVAVNGTKVTKVYYRGRRLLDGLLQWALSEGLSGATNLIYAGCSAGGLTTYLHTDYVAKMIPKTVQTVALADAMFAVEHNSVNNESLYPARMQWGYSAWNSMKSVNQACLADLGGANGTTGWKCMFGATAASYVQTPLFVLNSKYDTWQKAAIIGVNCTITDCPSAEQEFWVKYSQIMVDKAMKLPSRFGVFLSNCPAHCQTGIGSWQGTTIGGTPMGEAFAIWYNQTTSGQWARSTKWIETCDVHPCDTDKCA